MTEAEYAARAEELWPESTGEEARPELLELVRDAVVAHPDSAALWILLGDALHFAPDDGHDELPEIRQAYERAIECDPSSGEAYAELAWFHEAVLDDPAPAVSLFRKAIALGAAPDTALGLARALAETGEDTQALDLLAPLTKDPEIGTEARELTIDIEDGHWRP